MIPYLMLNSTQHNIIDVSFFLIDQGNGSEQDKNHLTTSTVNKIFSILIKLTQSKQVEKDKSNQFHSDISLLSLLLCNST